MSDDLSLETHLLAAQAKIAALKAVLRNVRDLAWVCSYGYPIAHVGPNLLAEINQVLEVPDATQPAQ